MIPALIPLAALNKMIGNEGAEDARGLSSSVPTSNKSSCSTSFSLLVPKFELGNLRAKTVSRFTRCRYMNTDSQQAIRFSRRLNSRFFMLALSYNRVLRLFYQTTATTRDSSGKRGSWPLVLKISGWCPFRRMRGAESIGYNYTDKIEKPHISKPFI